jgi:hypothetical protein
MRSLLQFLGAGSSALFATLLMGTLLTATGRADENPLQTLVGGSCTDCCSCSQANQNCFNPGSSRNCNGYPCNCICNVNSGGYWLCYPRT